ncbi:MAG: hypothetical protein HYT36_01930 [Candidatus Staskawiczbacteria bacterium]|nr:hypothetical protein [Candidatus Staskawiczbacteria bacterium]
MKKKPAKTFNFCINDLILFCIYSVNLNGEKCSFERLLKECFILSPESLSFARYPIWPDSRKLDRPLRSLRKENLVKGDPQTYFLLTEKGEKKALDAAKIFKQGKLL